jgi:hypothetical protein
VAEELQDADLAADLRRAGRTLEIMLVLRIFFLLMILTATSMLVRSCLAAA